MKTFQVWLMLSKITFALIIILNTILPIYSNKIGGFTIFHVIIMAVWFYGFLGSIGIIKKIVSKGEDGIIIYDTTIPFVPVGIFRVIEFLYLVWFKSAITNYKVFVVLVVLDVVYTLFLLLDKGSYYYESSSGEEV